MALCPTEVPSLPEPCRLQIPPPKSPGVPQSRAGNPNHFYFIFFG